MATPSLLYKGQLAAANATLIASPATPVIIKQFRVVNLEPSTARSFRLAIGGSAATPANLLWPEITLQAGDTFIDNDLVILPVGSTIQGFGSAASVLNCLIFGIVM